MDKIRTFIEKNKKLVIGLALFGILFFIYTNFFAGEDDGSYVSGEDKTIVNSEIGREIVNTLNQLKILNIDPDFFDDPVFEELTDFSVIVQPRPVGKANPFKEGASGAQTTTEGQQAQEAVERIDDEFQNNSTEEQEPFVVPQEENNQITN